MNNNNPGTKKGLRERLKYLKPFLNAILEPVKIIFQDPLGIAGAIIFSIIVLIAIFAPLLATHNPAVMNERIEGSLIAFSPGGEWQQYRIIGEKPINELVIGSQQVIAAAESGSVIRLQEDDSWLEEEVDAEIDFFAAAVSEEMIIVAGERGRVYFYQDNSWQERHLDEELDIHGLTVSPGGTIYAVGEEGAVFSWQDDSWQRLESGSNRTLKDINFIAEDDAIIVGFRGTIIHYRQGEFSDPQYRSFTDETFRDLNGLHYFSEELAFAVGERGTIMGYDGSEWFAMSSDSSRELRGVAVISPEEAYAVGYRGTIQEYDGENWQTHDRITRRGYRGITTVGETGYIYGVDPYVNELAPPSREHLFGTTHLGRDIWSQVIYGSRTALMVGIIAALMVNLLGFTVGLISGYYRGGVDSFLMRVVDIMYGMPLEPFAIVLVLIFGPGLWIIILAIGLLTWRTNARVIRSQVLSLVERPFIKAARISGASHLRIMLVHIAPNVLPLAFLQLAVAMGYAITAEATLSFLGLGPPRVYSWGTILHAARLSGAWRTAWWWIIPPGVFISATVVSVFLISRAVEVWTNPRLRGGNESAPEPEESQDPLPYERQSN